MRMMARIIDNSADVWLKPCQTNQARLRIDKEITSSLTFKVREHFITKNLWEYYVIDSSPSDVGNEFVHDPKTGQYYSESSEIQFCYVMGLENELGDVFMPEIQPHIISRTKDLGDVAPAHGYMWTDKE